MRDRIRVYSWIGGDRPADTPAAARAAVDRGFTAVKMNATEELQFLDSPRQGRRGPGRRRPRCARRSGRDVGIAVDFHGRVHKPMAKVLAQGAGAVPADVHRGAGAAGERRGARRRSPTTPRPRSRSASGSSRAGTSSAILADGYVDIIQPDPSHAGGITETRKIAAMAEAYDVALALHCPLGPIALAACLQLDARLLQRLHPGAEPRHPLQPGQRPARLRRRTARSSPTRTATSRIPHGPGLGIEIDEAYAQARRPGRPPLAQPDLAPCRRQLRRVVSGCPVDPRESRDSRATR